MACDVLASNVKNSKNHARFHARLGEKHMAVKLNFKGNLNHFSNLFCMIIMLSMQCLIVLMGNIKQLKYSICSWLWLKLHTFHILV